MSVPVSYVSSFIRDTRICIGLDSLAIWRNSRVAVGECERYSMAVVTACRRCANVIPSGSFGRKTATMGCLSATLVVVLLSPCRIEAMPRASAFDASSRQIVDPTRKMTIAWIVAARTILMRIRARVLCNCVIVEFSDFVVFSVFGPLVILSYV